MEKKNEKVLKRPRCAYTFFCKEKWAKMSLDLQTTDSKRIIPELARGWNNLGDNEKSVYIEMARKEKEEFKAKQQCA